MPDLTGQAGDIQLLRLHLRGEGRSPFKCERMRTGGRVTFAFFFFLIEHLVQELLTVITTLYARKQKQTAKISRKIYSVKI